MPSEDFLKEQERISLAEELMDLALMARGTQKLFSLIGKDCVFDLEHLQNKMNGLTKAQRDALEIKQSIQIKHSMNMLFDVVNDLTAKRKLMEQEVAKRAADLLKAEAEQAKLREEMDAQAAKAAQLAAEKEAKHKQSLQDLQSKFEAERQALLAKNKGENEKLKEKMEAESAKAAQLAAEKEAKHKKAMQELQSQFEAERNALLAKGDEARKKELEKLRSASAKEKAQLQEEMAKREAEFRQRMKELEESYAEAQRQRTEEEAAKNEELNSEIERLKAELEASLEKQAELEESLSASAVRSLQEQIGKLYWVNKELINQIRERDTQTKRLQVDYQSLQYEDQLKNMHIDTLDAKSREKDHQRDILLMTKKELEETNARLDRMAEEHKAEMAKLSQDNEMLAQLVSRKDAEIDELNTVVQSWKPKVESLSEKEKEVSNLKVDVAKTQTSFLKVKEELEKEQRRRSLMREQLETNQESSEKLQSSVKHELEAVKKSYEAARTNLRNKEAKCAQLTYTLDERESEIDHLRSRIKDLELYLSKSIAINKQLHSTSSVKADKRWPPAMATGIQLPTTTTTLSLERSPSIERKRHAVQKTI